MVQLSWSLQAKEDLKSIADYKKLNSVRYARLQVIKIKSKTQILKSYPQSGRIVPEKDDKKIREFIEGNYRIIYKILSDTQIDILTVHHSAKDFKTPPID